MSEEKCAYPNCDCDTEIMCTMAYNSVKQIESLRAELDREREKFDQATEVVIGWREFDWPEGFDRRTAQLIADNFSERLLSTHQTGGDNE